MSLDTDLPKRVIPDSIYVEKLNVKTRRIIKEKTQRVLNKEITPHEAHREFEIYLYGGADL